jgi:hypothetical protein
LPKCDLKGNIVGVIEEMLAAANWDQLQWGAMMSDGPSSSVQLMSKMMVRQSSCPMGIIMPKGDLTRDERLQIMLMPKELAALDDFRFKQRMPSRAAAVRELFRLGLASTGVTVAPADRKSGDFGVIPAKTNGKEAR